VEGPGGYQVHTLDGQVTVSWFTASPHLRDADPHEESLPKVIVTAALRFRAWPSG